jgi:cysteinyl-tRNA synthetase
MAHLNILPPQKFEYDNKSIHDTIKSIDQLIRIIYAYESNLSVYFDTLI